MKNQVRRMVVLAIAMMLGLGVAQAQFRFGIKAGMNINKVSISNLAGNFDESNRCGFTGGIMTEFQVPVVGLCLDASLMYSRMNSSVEWMTPTQDGTLKEESSGKNFFEIPINLKYKFTLPVVGSFMAPYIYTGPSFAFKLGGSDDVFKTKTFQCAWNVGIGIELISHLQISGGYSFGINNVADKVAGVTTSDDLKVKNNYWTITAAYLF